MNRTTHAWTLGLALLLLALVSGCVATTDEEDTTESVSESADGLETMNHLPAGDQTANVAAATIEAERPQEDDEQESTAGDPGDSMLGPNPEPWKAKP